MRGLIHISGRHFVDPGLLGAPGSRPMPAGLMLGLALDNEELWQSRPKERRSVIRRLRWLRPLLPGWRGKKKAWEEYLRSILLPASGLSLLKCRRKSDTTDLPRGASARHLDLSKQSRIRSQGSAPTCLCFAVCNCVEAADMHQGFPGDWRSARFFAYVAKTTSQGTSSSDAYRGLVAHGIPFEKDYPYDPSHSLPGPRPSQHLFREAMRLRPPEVLWVSIRDLDVLRRILSGGQSIVFGIPVFGSWQNRYTVATGIVPDKQPGDRLLGYHGVLLVGYDRDGFIFKNSWSYFDALGRARGWATEAPAVAPGYGKLSNRYMQEHTLPGAFRVPKGRVAIATPPQKLRLRIAAAAAALAMGFLGPQFTASQPDASLRTARLEWQQQLLTASEARGLELSSEVFTLEDDE